MTRRLRKCAALPFIVVMAVAGLLALACYTISERIDGVPTP